MIGCRPLKVSILITKFVHVLLYVFVTDPELATSPTMLQHFHAYVYSVAVPLPSHGPSSLVC